ncbi:MAG: DUF429 domain-containing protein [Burkholderiaceae bacterium]
MTFRLLGVDFTSAPSRRKPIVIAIARARAGMAQVPAQVALDELVDVPDFEAFEAALGAPGPWLGVFDLPFGLPRELVEAIGWPTDWAACMHLYASRTRAELRQQFRAWCDARPRGHKFAHRATDAPAGSSPSMKWVNPPVAWMMHAGVPRLIAAGVTVPGMLDGDRSRIALEGYPGMLARSVTRASYKSDTRARQTRARRIERERIIGAVRAGATRIPGAVSMSEAQARLLAQDPSGDRLDAVLCLLLAAHAWRERDRHFGLRAGFDPLEGWIVGA